MCNKEVWKTVVDFEGIYEVSNLGNVRSLTRDVVRGNGVMLKRGKIIAQNKTTNGYLTVHLYKDTVRTVKLVHRLVAEAFIPNPDNLPEVNHKDENKHNNTSKNLEWCTRAYNGSYGSRTKRAIITSLANNKLGIAVVAEPVDEGVPLYFKSMMDAKRAGYTYQVISAICTGRRGKTHKGYYWRYATEEEIRFENVITNKRMVNT